MCYSTNEYIPKKKGNSSREVIQYYSNNILFLEKYFQFQYGGLIGAERDQKQNNY